ncbi:VOC family protein [Histidinibacterium lentulum]|uniref:VOC family protein n=1 Tax=Histidinibacterium lentulum TaxID=2480588 RepID=A0A3N2QYN9_9RHOB|nr:VOC family protein [Histidinibacterium lentulum]
MSSFLVCPEADAVLAFAREVFGAEDIRPALYRRGGALWNAELSIGGSTIMVGASRLGFSRPGFVYVHVPDARATFDAAVAAGAQPVMPLAAQFYGDLDGGVEDMGGNWWWMSTHERSLSPDEIEAGARRQEAAA